MNLRKLLVGNIGDKDYGKKPVIVQGITGKYGNLHSQLMLNYGTNVVAGVVPDKGGQTVNNVPVFNNVKEAKKFSNAEIAIIFVPAPFFKAAALESLEEDMSVIVGITEHVPIRDTLEILKKAKEKNTIFVGPNTAGLIIPEIIKLGIMSTSPFSSGNIGIISKSGTLMYEIANYLTTNSIGQSLVIGIGGDPVNCTTLIESLELLAEDDATKGIVIVGEIGGDSEEKLAEYVTDTNYSKPIVGYIAGRHAPKEKKMGHAGAIIYGKYGTAESKINSFNNAGIKVATKPSEIPKLVSERLKIK